LDFKAGLDFYLGPFFLQLGCFVIICALEHLRYDHF